MTIKLDKKNEIKPNWTLSAKTTGEDKAWKMATSMMNSPGPSSLNNQFDKPGLKDFIIKAQSNLKKKKLLAGQETVAKFKQSLLAHKEKFGFGFGLASCPTPPHL